MNQPKLSPDAISARAYFLWENEGRPEGRADEFWLAAEHELQTPPAAAHEVSYVSPEPPEPEAAEPASISDLDRALPPKARREVRSRRQGSRPTGLGREAGPAESPEHFLVLLDRGHLRIFRAESSDTTSSSVPHLVHALDAPGGRESYVAGKSDQAGRFPGSRSQRIRGATAHGGTNDERLPMREERDRRTERDWSAQIEDFFTTHATSTWDYAAGPSLHSLVLERLSPRVRRRLRHSLSKDLVNLPAAELPAHFSPSALMRS
jgi:hypothetical protein